jgi:hypothetical protein
VVVAAAAGGGVALGIATSSGHAAQNRIFTPHVPAELPAAVLAERALLATVDAALLHAHGQTKRLLRAIRADHAAHLAAIRAALTEETFPPPTSSATASAPVPQPHGRVRAAHVRTAERRASRAAAARALRLSGRDAALFASIAASEATHAELLR